MTTSRTQTDIDIPRIGVVLSSGGVRGVYAHTGFLMDMENMKINIVAMAGCSAGAVVGGIYASGTPLQEWADALRRIKPKKFWTPSLLKMGFSFIFRGGRGFTGMSSTKQAMDFCIRHLREKTFEDCHIPFYTLAKNLLHGCKTMFSQGELAHRIIASAAAPLMYEPVEIDGQLYSDGALLELSPTDAICCKHQLDILIIHHVARRNKDQVSINQVLKKTWSIIEVLNILLYQQRPWYLSDDPITFKQCPYGCGAVIIVVEPELPELLWPATVNGAQVLNAVKKQAGEILNPYFGSIKSNKAALIKQIEIYKVSLNEVTESGIENENEN